MVDFVFLDSGTGGIPYLSYLKKVKPNSNCVYVADTANFPYGNKSHSEIVNCVLNVTSRIVEKLDPSVIVIACNTMSVNTLTILRDSFPDVQFVGTVPAIKLAASITKNKRIGLLATKSTCEHPYNMDLKAQFASDCELIMRPDPELISFIEHKSFDATEDEKSEAVKPAINFFKDKNCDVIILGCTHFLNLKDEIQKEAAKIYNGDRPLRIKIVDSCEGVVNRALYIHEKMNLDHFENLVNKKGKSQLYVTGFTDNKDEFEYKKICLRDSLEFMGSI